MDKNKALKIILILTSLYFLIAAFAHLFGLTIFPVYDSNLYTPYHDTLLALCDLIFVMIFIVVAINPVKNRDMLQVIMVAFVLVIFFNLVILWKIDFAALGSSEKRFQTIVETVLAVGMLVLMFIVRPKDKKR